MKLKKIASLMLAGVMAVSMLAGCKTTSDNGNGGAVPPTNNSSSSGLSAEILNMSAFRTSKVVNAKDSTSLDNAVKAAAGIMGNGNTAAGVNKLTDLRANIANNYGATMLNAAKSKMGDAKHVDETGVSGNGWTYVKNTSGNDGHTVYDLYVVAQNLGDETIKQLIADKLETIYNNIGVIDVKLDDSFSYDVSISMADWQVGKDADISKDGVVVGIAVTLHYDAAEFN